MTRHALASPFICVSSCRHAYLFSLFQYPPPSLSFPPFPFHSRSPSLSILLYLPSLFLLIHVRFIVSLSLSLSLSILSSFLSLSFLPPFLLPLFFSFLRFIYLPLLFPFSLFLLPASVRPPFARYFRLCLFSPNASSRFLVPAVWTCVRA